MTTYESTKNRTVLAGTSISIYRFIIEAADGQHDHSGAGKDADGVSAEAQSVVGGAVAMAMMNAGGVMKVEAGADVTLLSDVQSDSVGRAIDHSSSTGDYRLGKALEAGAVGEIIRVQLKSSLDEVT